MACDLSLGRLEPCKDAIGGLDAVYFINYEDAPVEDIAYDLTDTDLIATINPTPSTVMAYKYELKGTSTLDQTPTSSRENGTTFFEQVLTLNLKKQDIQTHKEIKLLTQGRPHIVVRDRNGNFFYVGLEWGAEVTGGTISTGAAMGDFNGYNLTLTAQEKAPANFIDSADEAGLADVGLLVVPGV